MTRSATITRKTSETQITLTLNLDKQGRGKIDTGSGFLDHMLDLLQVHLGATLNISCKGDTHIDMHHSCEDIAIALGDAFKQCIGDKKGIERYGFYMVTMDESLVRVALDLSGRFFLHYNAPTKMDRIGNIDIEMFKHFFYSFAENTRMNLHIDLLHGENTHHIIEGVFKAFARALAMAISPSSRIKGLASSKGSL